MLRFLYLNVQTIIILINMWREMCILSLFPRSSGHEQTAESKKNPKTKQKRVELLFSPSRFQFEYLLKSFQANKKNSSKTFKVSHISAFQLIWYSCWCHFQWKLCLGPSKVLTLISLPFFHFALLIMLIKLQSI